MVTIKADLHTHSVFSDGALSPEALFERALKAEVTLLALTDHDTVEGIARLESAARNTSMTILRGIELSVSWKMHTIHILGFNIDPDYLPLTQLLERVVSDRIERAKKIGELLKPFGLHDAYEKAVQFAGNSIIARPHFGQVLVNEGLVPDMPTAFKRFLRKGKPAFVQTKWVDLEEGVSCLKAAGGSLVIAHPLKYKLTRSKLNALISEFKSAGGEGIEVVSGPMTHLEITELASLCSRYNLAASTGSDYHGDNYSKIGPGEQPALPPGVEPIWSRWSSIK